MWLLKNQMLILERCLDTKVFSLTKKVNMDCFISIFVTGKLEFLKMFISYFYLF